MPHSPKHPALGMSDAPEVALMPLDYHRDDAGRLIDSDEAARLVEKDLREERGTPRDCVTEVPLHGGRVLQLVAWDAEGEPGPVMQLPADEVEDGDTVYLLERCRAIYRKTHPRHLKAV